MRSGSASRKSCTRPWNCRAPDAPPFSTRACNGNAELRAEVESLLASHDDAGTFIEESVAPLPNWRAAARFASASAPDLGPYRIVQLIAEGGMGAVYQAVRVDDLYRKVVAIKVIRRGVLRRVRAAATSIPSGRSWRTWITPISPSCWTAAPRRTAGPIS